MDTSNTAQVQKEMKMNYTYNKNLEARSTNDETVVVPDQVAADQKKYDGETIPVYLDGSIVAATLRGDLYGLHTAGTGDMIVSID